MPRIEMKYLRPGLLLALLVASWVAAINFEIDLVNLYQAAKFLNTDVSRVYMKNEPYGRYFYGPISLVLIKPLGLLSWTVVKYFWIGLQTVSFFFFWKLLYRLYPFLLGKKSHWAWITVLIVTINPLHNNFQSNNIQLMLMALFLWAEVWSEASSEKKQFWAGAIISLAAMIKVFPAFLAVFYFLTRSSKVRWGVVGGALLWLVLPVFFFGIADSQILYRGFFEHLFTYNNEENSFTRVQDLLCLPSLLTRLMPFLQPAALSLVIKASILAIAGGFYAFSWKASLRPMGQRERLRWWAMALALMTFLNPSTRPHYFIFYVPAFCALLEVIQENTANIWTRASTVLSVMLIAFTAQGAVGKEWNDKLEYLSLPTWGMLILCLGLTGLLLPNKSLKNN